MDLRLSVRSDRVSGEGFAPEGASRSTGMREVRRSLALLALLALAILAVIATTGALVNEPFARTLPGEARP